MTPREVRRFCRGKQRSDGRLQISRFRRHLAALHHPHQRIRAKRPLRKDSVSTAPPSAAGSRFTTATCCSCPIPTTAKIDPFLAVPTLSLICNIFDPITKEGYYPRPPLHRQESRSLSEIDRHRAIPPISAPSPNSSSLTTFATAPAPTSPSMPSIPAKGSGTPAAKNIPTSATSPATRKAISPAPRPTP